MTSFSASPQVYTCRWSALKGLPSFVVPVRISIGKPRFIPGAAAFDAIHDLMPYGLLNKGLTHEEFAVRFRNRLDKKGVEAIQQAFDDLHERYRDRPLVLMCYEDLTQPEKTCHRTVFADWWKDRTGAEVLELQFCEVGDTELHVEQPSPAAPPPPPAPPPAALF